MAETPTLTVNGYPARFDVSSKPVEVTSDRDSVDPNWRYTDDQGHAHYYDGGYPTLDHIIDASHWCDGTEGLYNHDPHLAVDADHYECLICRQTVAPGVIPAGTPQFIAGPVEVSAVVDGDAGDSFEFMVDGTLFQFSRVGRSSARGAVTSKYVGVPYDVA